MIETKEKITTLGTEGLKSYKFGIKDVAGLANMFHILRNKTYKNKILAPLREYSTNAYDAHVDAGIKDKPIEVSLPHIENPELSIRDFGKGLSEDEIENIYCNYGTSTKATSNDFVGQFGIGSKSGFSYGDSFTIISRRNGLKTIYSAYIDETRLGTISKLIEEDCTEPSGLEIKISVNEDDIHTFAREAAILFSYFKTEPTIIAPDNIKEYYNNNKPTNPDVKFFGDDWKLTGTGRSVVIMGNVGYQISSSGLSDIFHHLKQLLDCGIIFEFNIGDVDITSSREDVEYTEKTQNVVAQKLAEIYDIIKKQIESEVVGAQNVIEAKLLYAEKFNTNNIYGKQIISLFADKLEFQGVKINSRDVVSVPTDCSCQKLRCCNYKVICEVKENLPIEDALVKVSKQEINGVSKSKRDAKTGRFIKA